MTSSLTGATTSTNTMTATNPTSQTASGTIPAPLSLSIIGPVNSQINTQESLRLYVVMANMDSNSNYIYNWTETTRQLNLQDQSESNDYV